jgi:hypothetical protein
MATNTEVNVRINVDAKGANGSVGSIKKQLKEATNELLNMRDKFGDTSAEAVQAAKKVADLKDAIGDAKAMTDAFDPDAKFKAFGAALQGVAGGFAAVQGAQALFGAESEAVSKTLAKVQGAMALSQGINSILQARDSFKNLGAVLQNVTVIQKALNFVMTGSFKTQQSVTQAKQADIATTTAQTAATTGLTIAQNIARVAAIALRGAIMATGIGAIVIGIIALIDKIMEWTGVSDEAEKKQQEIAENANQRNKEISEANIKRLQQSQELAIREAEIAGASQKEIFALRIKGANNEINALEKRNNEIRKQYAESSGALRDALNEELTTNKKAQQDLNFEINKIKQDGRKADLDNARAYQDQLAGLQQSNYLASIRDEDKRAKEKSRIDFENNVKKLADTEFSESERTELEKQYAIQRDNEIAKINQAAYDKQKAKRDAANKEITDAQNNLNKQIEALNNELLLSEIKNEDERAKKKLEIQLKAQIKEVENSKANESLKLDAIMALKMKFDADVQAIDDATAAKKAESDAEKREKEIEFQNETDQILQENRINNIQDANQRAFEQESLRFQNEVDALYQQLNTKEITEEEFRKRREALEAVHETNVTAITKTASEERANAHAAEVQARGEVLDAYGTMVTGLVGVFKEAGVKTKGFQIASLIVEQAAAIAKIITSTQTANAAALATPQAIATSGAAAAPVILRNNIQAGISIATAIAAAAKGIAQIRGANANGSAGGGGTLPAGSGGAAPLPPQLSTTMLNQGQINQLSSATARAFVLESDVSGNQERIQRLNRAARIS